MKYLLPALYLLWQTLSYCTYALTLKRSKAFILNHLPKIYKFKNEFEKINLKLWEKQDTWMKEEMQINTIEL